MSSLSLVHEWRPVLASADTRYFYPAIVGQYMLENYSQPTVYRWMIVGPSGEARALYFGEADNLPTRIKSVLKPGKRQPTNVRLKRRFEEEFAHASTVELDWLQFEPIELDDLSITQESLVSVYVRRMLENLCIILGSREEIELLNRSYLDGRVEEAARVLGNLKNDQIAFLKRVKASGQL